MFSLMAFMIENALTHFLNPMSYLGVSIRSTMNLHSIRNLTAPYLTIMMESAVPLFIAGTMNLHSIML